MAKRERVRQPRARNLCGEFAGPIAGCARGGLGALRAEHKALVPGNVDVRCSIDVDACLSAAEPAAPQWDYLLLIRNGARRLIGMEVHHAAADQIENMIDKKKWAQDLLARDYPRLITESWHWLVPPGADILFTQSHPGARSLADAGITFPRRLLSI